MASTAQTRVTKHYATGRFGQAHYRRAAPLLAAAKPALLLFHMSPLSGRIYEKFLGVMGGHRLSIAPDTPGFGDSDVPATPPTIEDYAAAMGDMMDDLKLRQVDVMGYHTGAETCVALALARPHQVRKLILVSAPIFTPEELKSFRAHYAHEEINEDGAHLVRKWKGHLHWAGPGWTKELVAQQFPDALRNPLTSWWGHNAAFGYDMAGALAKVTQPVLVLNPDDDLHTQTLRAAPLLKNGRVVHLKGWGHGFQDVRTAEACDLVNTFLDEER